MIEDVFFSQAYGPRKTRNVCALNTAIQLELALGGDILGLQSYTLLGDPAVGIIKAESPDRTYSAT